MAFADMFAPQLPPGIVNPEQQRMMQAQGMLAAAAPLLQAAAPSTHPIGLGEGLAGAIQGLQQHRGRAQKSALLNAQFADRRAAAEREAATEAQKRAFMEKGTLAYLGGDRQGAAAFFALAGNPNYMTTLEAQEGQDYRTKLTQEAQQRRHEEELGFEREKLETTEAGKDRRVQMRVGATRQALSSARQDDLRGGIQTLGRAVDKITTAKAAMRENAAVAGLPGALAAGARTTVGMARDVARAFGADDGGMIDDLLKSAEQSVQEDPVTRQLMVMENSLAYALARARKGGGRLNRQDVEDARRDTNLVGLTSTEDVMARLDTIQAELESAMQDYQSRLQGKTGREDVRGLSDDALMQMIWGN